MPKPFFRKLRAYFTRPVHLAVLNGVLIAILLLLNCYFQAFCIPTTWAAIVLAVCFASTVAYPLLAQTRLAPLTALISGITVCVLLYCIIFLEQMNLIGPLLIPAGLGLAVFIPHFLLLQLLWRNVIKPRTTGSTVPFMVALLLCAGAVAYVGHAYRNGLQAMERFKASGYQELDRTFMTEKMLGMHLIYHTRFCEYDGWRPPKHEPILVMGMWLNDRRDPLHVDLRTRLALYKHFFPERRYKFDCSCGYQYRQDYHRDDLWKSAGGDR
ncbi:MAG TPA: hypothetical protein PKD45_05870 [Flavobacteriales bacterium]|nr:hypothetical protein [Flavobacteriales bacterium]